MAWVLVWLMKDTASKLDYKLVTGSQCFGADGLDGVGIGMVNEIRRVKTGLQDAGICFDN